MKLIFKGKVALVTGGSGGIGLEVSKRLAKDFGLKLIRKEYLLLEIFVAIQGS